MQMKSEHLIHMKAKFEWHDMQKTKSERLTAVLANVIQMKSEHLIHMKAKSVCLICRRQNLNV